MNIAILDDETHCVESLVIHINNLFPEAVIIYKSTKPLEAVEVLKRIDVNLLLLDVEMPLMDGFEFLEQFDKLDFEVIFTTAYSQYAIKAFRAQAINYLLKPIDEDELNEAILLCMEKKRQTIEPSLDIDQLLGQLKQEHILKDKIAIPTTDGLEFIDVSDIIYCNSQSNYTMIFTRSKRPITISKTLKEIEKSLEKFSFLRVHQSYLINPNHIKKYIRNDGGFLIMSDDSRIPISQSKKNTVVELFEKLKN
ncbi:LytR/AlgR family response regulator transcription factor [Sphingobacterium faecale]|uniref:Response regulator transcription factor n=1 Tax=Sphingobacterium faecale TaxID=2803775 RepID=A0ABS1QZH8_9SPHI|nr:LytTR family DNA-binding domain-containing protein [Sphingobacterium faecale]MBL1407841.1 response regulator transcription factor [Sphingobacterium faecale]